MPPETDERRISRFANIEAPDQAPVETDFSIQVSLTRERLSDDTVVSGMGDATRPTADGAINFPCPEPCVVTAVLFAPGFTVAGTNSADFRLAADRDAPPARFILKSRPGLKGVPSELTADFWRQGTFVAKVKRRISIGEAPRPTSTAPDNEGPRGSGPAPRNVALAFAQRSSPDLTVRWEEMDLGGLHYCLATVYSPSFPAVRSEPCTPGEQIQKFLAQRYNGVLKTALRGTRPAPSASAPMTPQQIESQLRGLGRELYEQYAPRNFKLALEQLRAPGNPPLRTIQIDTNDPTLPWELMVPCDRAECAFLGTDYQVARWHISNRTPDLAPQLIRYATLEALAPRYSGSSYLPDQQKEIQALSGVPGFEAAGGKLDDFRHAFEASGGSILHFAGHGQSDQGYQIRMEDAEADPTMLRGWRRGSGARLYFWNACDSGQEKTIAGFVDGWAPALLDSGAGGFIGGMWPLGDAAAAQFAEQFYASLKAGLGNPDGVQIAQLVQSGRSRFLQTGDPTYLAYVFYGDVRLTIKR